MQRLDNTDVTTPLTSTSQFIEADNDDDLDDEAIPGFTHPALTPDSAGKGKGRDEQSVPGSALPRSPVSGNIGSSSNGSARPARSTVGGVQVEMRNTGLDTLDEPISTTIGRDLLSIYTKTIQVLYPPKASHREVLRDWDLWGPLVISLTLGILLSIRAAPDQSLPIFTSVVCLMTSGSLVVTVQAKLLGGRVSFFQGLCVFGYCVAPLNIAALVSVFVPLVYVRLPITFAAWAWCIWASVNFLDGTKLEKQRTMLAVYPLLLFYSILAWMIVIE
ncbi:Yip1-domain-containing protein [Daedalea quercina L-15889]|uniref:Protein YIP n=1 Tax=Daedalea quercina L-15889 TaxID=1314783 RepID=A0A165T6V6_9APHY|nr:Yip1-domain-containing protein [Daedalea quercina L-15889]